MSIKLDHNGYEITYSENEDLWRCWVLDLEAAKLSTLKDKVNKIDADNRRLSQCAVWHIGYSGQAVLRNAVLVDTDSVWLVTPGTEKKQRRREKVKLESVALDTPENRALIGAYHTAGEVSAQALRAVSAARSAIPRATAADLRMMGAKDDTA